MSQSWWRLAHMGQRDLRLQRAAVSQSSQGDMDRKTIQKNTEIENLIIFNGKNKYEPVESLSMTMENQILLDVRSVIDSGIVPEIFSQNSPVSSENFNLETAVINNPIEEGLLSSQDNRLCTVNVGETLLDHFKYPLTIENQNTTVKVEVHPYGNNSCDDEDLEKYKELNLPEEAEHMHYLPSNGVQFLSSVAMQHKNCSVPTSTIFSQEGTVNQNVRMIPVFRSFIPPVAGENKCICHDQFKGIQNNTMQLQNLTNCLNESSSDICGLPQTSASVYDEIAEVREAVSNVIENHQDRAIFQSSNVDESGCKLLALHSVVEESRCSHRNYSNPVVICQLEGGTQILCINTCGTQELKPLHLIPEYHNQHNYLQSDVDNPETAVLAQFLPVPGELVLNEQEACLDRNPEAFLPKIGKRKLGEIKPHRNKGCNCKRSGCLKNYCECFEVSQAKIMCSCICKCIGCKNYEESPDEKNQLNVLNYMEIGNNEGNSPVLTSTFKMLPKLKKDRQPAVCISWEEVKAVCACLLVQAEEAEKRGYSVCLAERMIMEEFGRCLSQILYLLTEKRVKKCCTTAAGREERETTLQTPKSVKEEEEVLQVLEQRSPCSLCEDYGDAGCPLQPMEAHAGADIHLAAYGRPHASEGSSALKKAAACGEPKLEQAPGRKCDLVGDPCRSSPFLK
ncbi:hypothetical protein QYF61_027362, partial [Mycteria americana]